MEAVGQHSLGDLAAPLAQDFPGVAEPTRRQAEAAKRDEGVASPVDEPRVARDDGLSPPATDQVVVRGAVEPGREEPPAPALRAPQTARQRQRIFLGGERAAGEEEHRLALRKVELKDSGRGEVFQEIETAGALLLVEELPVPGRVVLVRPAGGGEDLGQTLVRT